MLHKHGALSPSGSCVSEVYSDKFFIAKSIFSEKRIIFDSTVFITFKISVNSVYQKRIPVISRDEIRGKREIISRYVLPLVHPLTGYSLNSERNIPLAGYILS